MEKEVDISPLVEAILKLKTEDEIKALLSDILTRSEQETLLMRLRVAKMLNQGTAYREIEKATGASSATIAKISEYLKYGYDGYRIVLDRLDSQ